MADIDYSAQRRLRVLEKALGLTANEDIETVTPITGGSGSPGAPVVRKFPFAFDTPDLLTGHAVWTPAVDDILLDAWFEIGTAWDGTSPAADIGTYVSESGGIFQTGGQGAIDLTTANADGAWGGGLGLFEGGSNAGPPLSFSQSQAQAALPYTVLPARFVSAAPIKVLVFQRGSSPFVDPGATQGAAVLYLVTATPV